ncbi:hypothetical protein FHG87_011823 [Trinorchestia longiramus]|nr:hypothetical protein FHG87_011823 [Trinorchestia longiramus]
MPPSLSPQELLNVKKSLVQHSGFMTDKTLLNDLLCSLDRKLQIHHVSESYPITSLAVGASGRLSPRVMDGTNTLFGPVRNGSSLTVQPSEALPSFPSREHERITGTPLKIGKRPAWNSAAFQKRLSSTPTSKILPQASLGGKPTVVRSLNDSLSFSEISSPQSCYASPLRVFSGGEICQQNSTSSKETFPKETSTSDIEKNNANGEKHFKMALSCDTLQPIQSDHLVGSDSVLLNHRFTHSNGGREADRLHEIHASDPRHERKISNEQNSEVDRALQNCNSFGIVPPPVQYASLKQVTFVSHPDILSSSAADISEVSEHCTVDSQATISGPSLVSEVAKTDPPFEQFNGDSIVQRQLSIEPTGSATPGNDSVLCEAKKLKANHESDGQCSRNTVVLQLQASEPLDKKTHNEVMKNDKQLFCTNIVTSDSSVEKDLLAFAQDSLQANMPVTASSMSSEANGYNNASHTKSHYNLGSVDAGETTDFHTDETHTKSRYNFGSLDTKETVDFPADETAVNTVGTRVAESDGTAGTPKQISGLNLVPKNEATHRSCGSCEAGNSYRTADSSQTGINYESTCTRRYERTPEAADASNICEDGNRELEEALQHEKERCQFLLASLVKMEEQYLRAEREKRHALAAVAALEEKQKSLLDLHCCGVRMVQLVFMLL